MPNCSALVWCGLVALTLLAPAATTSRAGERYAFLVAVREYDKAELTNLQFTENDIQKLADTLLATGYAKENVVLMTQTVGATKTRFLPLARNIRQELALVVRELAEDDSVLVAFSGHGVQFKDEKSAYYCPADAKLADRDTLVALDDVYKQLEQCAARTKVLFVDACRNDPQSSLSKSAREVELEAVGRRLVPTPPGGIAALFSCSATEQSFEDPDLKQGVFFYYVNEGLGGKADLDKDGEVSLAELELHVTKNVQRHARIQLGRAQTPERRGEARGLVSLARAGTGSVPMPMPPDGGALKVGEAIDNSIGMRLVLVLDKAIEFAMGAAPDDEDAELDETQHSVQLTRPFLIAAHEVTQGQYEQVVGDNPSHFSTTGKGASLLGEVIHRELPVDSVSFSDATDFCKLLSARQAEREAGRTYRLPTEAEWEYACRAGTTSPFAVDGTGRALTAKAANIETRQGRTTPVGAFMPNKLGLFDMHGNVWEWCQDYYGRYTGQAVDPKGPASGTERVLRGGSWQDGAASCRSSYREHLPPTKRTSADGFRVVCEITKR